MSNSLTINKCGELRIRAIGALNAMQNSIMWPLANNPFATFHNPFVPYGNGDSKYKLSKLDDYFQGQLYIPPFKL